MPKEYPVRPCVICKKDNTRRGQTCSIKCATEMRAATSKVKLLTCVLCKQQFTTKDGTGKYCQAAHFKKCEVCQKDFIIPKGKEHRENPTCGPTCGAKYSHRLPESKEKRKRNNLAKYGVEHTFQRKDVKAKIAANPNSQNTKYGSEGFKQIMLSKYGVENAFLLPNAVPGRISNPNRRWREALEEATGLSWALEKNIEGAFNVDLYCEHAGVKLAVEINPTATHNSYKHLIACNRRGCEEFPCSAHAKNKKYHYGRVQKLQESGIQLVSVFDWHNEKRIIEFIKAKLRLASHKVGARKCQLRKISQKEANSFLREFHLMGASRKQTHCYGLFFEELLVQVQTFTPLGDNRWEAKRLATRDDWAIAGGVSKGTKAFIAEVKPDEIIAFSDLNLSMAGFDSLFNGFEPKEIQAPSKCWSKDNRMILAKSAAFQSADRLLGIAPNSQESKYPPEWSNEQVFLAEGWLPVWDCGKLKEVLNLQ